LDLKNEALKHFVTAAACGWTDYRSALVDPRFENLRTNEQFREAIDAIRQRMALLREGASMNGALR
jgi:hypothetical protein